MKVICIDASKGRITNDIPPFKESDILTIYRSKGNLRVINEHKYGKTGRLKWWYKGRFIPLSNIDETELIKEREHETCKI